MVTESHLGRAPKTLMEAHELLSRIRPSKTASRTTWLSYYRQSAAVYAEIAEIDRGHHHEALYWADRESRKVRSLQAEITKDPDPQVTQKVRGVQDKQ